MARYMGLFATVLRTLFGVTFIASAILKFFPIEAFELILIKQVGLSWSMAPMAARVLIVVEFSLGLMLVAGYRPRLATYLGLLMITVFSAYLAALIINGKGDENCGCFGELIPMDAYTSLIKNAALLGLGLLSFLFDKYALKWRYSWISLVLSPVFLVITFIVTPLPERDLDNPANIDYALIKNVQDETGLDLCTGHKILVVMHASCIHCKQLATFLSSAPPEAARERLRLLIFGPQDVVDQFVADTQIGDFPHARTRDHAIFEAIEGTFPTILEVEDERVKSHWRGSDVNLDLLSTLLDKEG